MNEEKDNRQPEGIGAVVESGGCLSVPTDGNNHAEMDAYGKTNGLTVVFASWHPNPAYRIFKTGSLLSGNEEYPSGLVIVNERGVPQPWHLLRENLSVKPDTLSPL